MAGLIADISITTWCLIGVAGVGAALVGLTLMADASRTVTAVVADDQDAPPPLPPAAPARDGRHREDGTTQRIVPPPPMYPRP